MRRRRRLRYAEPTEVELMGESDDLAKQAAEVLKQLREVAFTFLEDLEEVVERQHKVGDGAFMFLIDDLGSFAQLKESVDEFNQLMRPLAEIKQRHDAVSDEYNFLSGGWETKEQYEEDKKSGFGRGW